LEAVVAKVYDLTSPYTSLSHTSLDVAAAGREINSWYQQAVVSIKLTDHSKEKSAIHINYDPNKVGVLILEPGVVSPGEKAIKKELKSISGQKVVIVKKLAWFYYLSTVAAVNGTKITMKPSYFNVNPEYSYLRFFLKGRTYWLGQGANRETITIKEKSKTDASFELSAALKYAHTTADALEFPLGGLSGNPIFVIEEKYTIDNIRWVIGHECGHSLLAYRDLECPDAMMHFSMGNYKHGIFFRDIPTKYEPVGNENQWEMIAR
jgi:hypothetical protein